MSDKEVIKGRDYFLSEKFDCSREFLLTELSNRAEWWSRLSDGSYSIPTGQVGQIYATAIAANLKNKNQDYWRDLVDGEALKTGDRYYSPKINSWVIVDDQDLPQTYNKERSYPTQRNYKNC